MKFRLAVFYVVIVHLLAAMLSFILSQSKNDTKEGIMREAYEEQEMLYRSVRAHHGHRLTRKLAHTDMDTCMYAHSYT